MKTYNRKPEHILAARWDGTQDGEAVTDLENFGYQVVLQTPVEKTQKVWDDETESEKEIPSEGMMVAVGSRNWDTVHVNSGEYVAFKFTDADGKDVEVTPDQIEDAIDAVRAGQLYARITTIRDKTFEHKFEV